MCSLCVRHVAGPSNMSFCRITPVSPAPSKTSIIQLRLGFWSTSCTQEPACSRAFSIHSSHASAEIQTPPFQSAKTLGVVLAPVLILCCIAFRLQCLNLHIIPFKSCWAILPFRIACSKKVSTSCLENLLPRNHPSCSAVTVASRMWSTGKFLEFQKIGG